MPEQIRERGQCAEAVMMVRPRTFRSNPQTAPTNAFQPARPGLTDDEQQRRALSEFDGLVAALGTAGVRVVVFDDSDEHDTPDAVFPNGWVSFHGDGTVLLYPLLAENRRDERRVELIDELADTHGFDVGRIIDLSESEARGRFMEGMGSVVLDRVRRIAYAGVSPRTDTGLVENFARRFGYRAVTFAATTADGAPVCHTSLVLSVGDRLAVVCADSIDDPASRERVVDSLRQSGRQVVEITRTQMTRFAANMVELRTAGGDAVIVMSAGAAGSLSSVQRAAIEAHARIVTAAVFTIESCAGGGVRDMLAELHLPQADAP